MTNPTKIALGLLEDRVLAGPADRISLRDYIVDVEIGAFEVERDVTQRLKFNIVVEVAPVSGALQDDVDKILSYDTLIEAVNGALASERLNLLETLAEQVALRILRSPQADRVFLRVEKPDRGPFDLGVEIVRSRTLETADAATNEVSPIVIYLEDAAEDISGWMGLFEKSSVPIVLCMGPQGRLQNDVGEGARRRIDLLQIDQNAWLLAARDERFSVVATKTELEWAMRQGHICVWAPSKIVLDAVNAPSGAVDGLELSLWFSQRFQASELVIMGSGSHPDARSFDPAYPKALRS